MCLSDSQNNHEKWYEFGKTKNAMQESSTGSVAMATTCYVHSYWVMFWLTVHLLFYWTLSLEMVYMLSLVQHWPLLYLERLSLRQYVLVMAY